MPMPRRPFPALFALALASGCAPAPAAPPATPAPEAPAPVVATPSPAAPAPIRAGTSLSGQVRGPAGMVAAGGLNLVAAGGGNLVAAGGGNVLPSGAGNVLPSGAGNVLPSGAGGFAPAGTDGFVPPAAGGRAPGFGLLATEEAPIGGVWVELADATGQAYAAIPPVQADADGRFTFQGVPAGLTFVVQGHVLAKGKPTRLLAIARSAEAGATTELSAPSTMVTAAAITRPTAMMGAFDPLRFAEAVAATRQGMAAREWPDLGDRAACLEAMQALAASNAKLGAAIDGMRTDIARMEGDIARLQAELEALRKAIAAPTPAPAATRTPDAVTTTAPTAAPTPMPEPLPTPPPRPTATPTPPPAVPSGAITLSGARDASAAAAMENRLVQPFVVKSAQSVAAIAFRIANADGGPVPAMMVRLSDANATDGAPYPFSKAEVRLQEGTPLGRVVVGFPAPIALTSGTTYALEVEALGDGKVDVVLAGAPQGPASAPILANFGGAGQPGAWAPASQRGYLIDFQLFVP